MSELPTAGIHDDIPEAEYHADTRSLSVSGAKVIRDCPARYRYAPRVESDAFDFGHVAHELILGKGGGYAVIDADDWRGKDARTQRDDARADGLAPILRKDFARAQALAQKVLADPAVEPIMRRGKAEQSMYATDPDTGVLLRGRADWLTEKVDATPVIFDVKTTVNASRAHIEKSLASLGYAMQAAWYVDLLAANGHPGAQFVWAFAEKNDPHIVTTATPDEEALDYGRRLNRRAIDTYATCLETGIWPNYMGTDPTSAITVSVASWAWKELES